MCGVHANAKRRHRGLRTRRAGLAAAAVGRKHGQRAPIVERHASGTTRDVAAQRPQSLHLGGLRLGPGRARARARGRGCRDLPRHDLAVEERDDDRLGEGLRRGGCTGRREHRGTRASDADDRAVRRILERLHVGRRRRRPFEIAENDGVLPRNRDAQEERACARRRTAWRGRRGCERRRADEHSCDRYGEADHGESG